MKTFPEGAKLWCNCLTCGREGDPDDALPSFERDERGIDGFTCVCGSEDVTVDEVED